MSKLNPFMVGNILMNLGAAIWFFKSGYFLLGLLNSGYAFCSLVVLAMPFFPTLGGKQ